MSRELETVIGIVLLNDRQVSRWPLKDVQDLRRRLCDAIANTSVLEALDKVDVRKEKEEEI